MRRYWNAFWAWYERHYTVNVGVAAVLFLLQFVHLIWLGGEVVAHKLTGQSLFTVEGIWHWIIILIDYTEIPALISISAVYINDLRKGFAWKALLYLIFVNVQWLHLFWITDEFVVDTFRETTGTILPNFLAWIAILIDYLEVPVIIETFYKFFKALKERRVKQFLVEDFREE